ncbi:glycosyltransferase family 4 protein [Chryseobacterium taichungense]|uniref:glycosyltransferase family 4 protein n=1 Tax=Chryseobacterium taichungense TaxID=295069 RepID=UPI0028AB1111|nr:glycosyltransferase family 4 protein [Chryseobacterium taichungense]
MRILKIVNSKDSGGVFNCERQFIKEFQKQGVHVDLVILGEGDNKHKYISFVGKENTICISEIDSYKSGSIYNRVIDVFSSRKEGKQRKISVIDYFKNNSYEAVIFRRQYYNFMANEIGKYFKVPVYWHIPGVIKSKFLKAIYTILLKYLKIIPVANSKYTQSTLGSICKYVVYPGFDEQRTSSLKDERTFRNKYGIPNDACVFGVAARIYPGKAQHLVIDSFLNSNINENNYLIIAGKIVDKNYWDSITSKYEQSFNKNIIYIGEIDNVKDFYASIDVLINGGQEAEAFGISVAEGIGSSKPVMAYGLGGPLEMIDHGVNGWIVKNPTIEDYIDTFRQSNKPILELQKMGEKSKEKSREFTVENNVQRFIKIIQNEYSKHK